MAAATTSTRDEVTVPTDRRNTATNTTTTTSTPSTTTSHDRSKVLSVRLTDDEFDRLSSRAHDLGVGASTLARTLIRQGLSFPPVESARHPVAQGNSPLERQIVDDLVARIETLERWVADH